MAYHTSKANKPMNKPKKPMNSNKPKNSKKLTDKQMKQLETHSKKHKGGMNSKHMKNMKKFMKEGMSFSMAHKKAVAIDKK